MKYDKILVKIEDKKECKLLKESIKNRYKVALHMSEDKEAKLNENGGVRKERRYHCLHIFYAKRTVY